MVVRGADSQTLWVIYRLTGVNEGEARSLAEKICLEQTVELDSDLVWDHAIRDGVVGKIAAITANGVNEYFAKVGYDWRVTGMEVPQFLNVLFGNSCFMPNVQLWDCDFHGNWLPGPRYGLEGIRKACGASEGPLLCSALKPMGSSVEVLANMARELALGGLHVLKDDHGLANQVYHPFETRVLAVSQAIRQAHDIKGQTCLYFPNFAPPLEKLDEYLEICKRADVPGILISPHLVGMDMVRYIREHSNFMLMLHPAWTGGHLVSPQSGVRPAMLLGKLFRALGGDGAIFPNAGGRFGFDPTTCNHLVSALRDPESPFLPACPIPAGGMSLAQIPDIRRQYGDDVMLLIGSGLYRADRDLQKAMAVFRKAAGHDGRDANTSKL